LPRACSRRSLSTTPSERTCPPPSRPAVELKKQIPALLKLTNPGATSVAFKVSVPSIGPQEKTKPVGRSPTQAPHSTLTHSPLQVKTTSPKKYVVRPNTGVVPPGGVAEVSVHRIKQRFCYTARIAPPCAVRLRACPGGMCRCKWSCSSRRSTRQTWQTARTSSWCRAVQ
jgi:MSP (Major sperm protein) domain